MCTVEFGYRYHTQETTPSPLSIATGLMFETWLMVAWKQAHRLDLLHSNRCSSTWMSKRSLHDRKLANDALPTRPTSISERWKSWNERVGGIGAGGADTSRLSSGKGVGD